MERKRAAAPPGTTRRRLGAVAGAAIALAPLAAACGAGGAGGGASTGPTDPVGAPAAPARVEVWHAWSGPREPLAQQVFEGLTRQYPTLRIDPVVQSVNSEAGATKLTAAVAGGAPPDALMIYQDLIPQFGPRTRVLGALDDYMRRDGVRRDLFYDADIAACAAAGATWLLPHVLPNTYTGLLYNKALTERAGIDFDKRPAATWAELEERAAGLSAPQAAVPTVGLVMDVGTDRNVEAWWGTQALAAYSADGRRATFAAPPAVEVVEWMLRLRERVSPPAALDALTGGKAIGQGSLTEAFTAGRLAILQTAMYNGYTVSQTTPDLRWGVMPVVPRTAGQKMALPHKDAWGFGLTAAGKARDAAWLVVKRMTADESGGGWLMVQQGRPSPLKSVNDSPEQRRNNPYYEVYKRLNESRWTHTGEWAPAEATRIYTETLARIAAGQAAPGAALQAAAPRVQAILDRELPAPAK
jgi:ABC-type glycerol-3-phosphate transport system substrate-binding protein